MVPLVALVLASVSMPAGSAGQPEQGTGGAIVSARASARVLPAVTIRQGQTTRAETPALQITRQPDGTVLVEFT
ncbi:MAG: hypothetical protein KJZ64_12310 [Sphingomonadaceae bacterium]|nr:hypothetical protein [Sphingomonadaceae bacterium]